MNYEQAVDWLRAKEEYSSLVRLSYLDEDIVGAAQRFAASEEATEVSRLLKLPSSEKMTILDIGCGNGIAAYALAAMGHDVVGIDPDPSAKVGVGAFCELNRHSRGAIRPLLGAAEAIPLSDGCIDRVYTRQAVHHFQNIPVAMRECARVLRPGGMLLATREHVVSDAAEREVFLRDHVMQSLHGNENAFAAEEYISAMEGAGLRVLSAMGRFETVINYYPGRERERIDELVAFVLAKKGAVAEWFVRRLPFLQRRVASILSRFDHYPGRLHSFLALKS